MHYRQVIMSMGITISNKVTTSQRAVIIIDSNNNVGISMESQASVRNSRNTYKCFSIFMKWYISLKKKN